MGANSKIEWTDHTFNPWRGCQHAVQAGGEIHPACEHCYAETLSKRNPAVLGRWGADGTRVMADHKMWREPLKWNAASAAAWPDVRKRVFCASLADVFEDWEGPVMDHRGEMLLRCDGCGAIYRDDAASDSESCEKCNRFKQRMEWLTLNDLRRDLFALIDYTSWLDWLLLTKRPENLRRMWPGGYDEVRRSNVWLGTSISDQATADKWVPKLLECRDLAPVLFLSIEPLLGPVDLDKFLPAAGPKGWRNELGIDWVIAGGESGPQARPMHPDWARGIRDQCQAAGVPFFFKQWGEFIHSSQLPYTLESRAPGELHYHNEPGAPLQPEIARLAFRSRKASESLFDGQLIRDGEGGVFARVGKAKAGRLLDGREWSEFPKQGTFRSKEQPK